MYLKADFENEAELDESKLFGEITLPEKWLEDNVFAPDEMFVCQLEIEKINALRKGVLPFESGMLFFFIDVKKPPYKAIIRYYDGEMNAYCCFNDEIECDEDVISEIKIDFSENDADSIGEMFFTDENTDGLIAVLKICYDAEEPILPFDGDVYFLMSLDDLKKGDFSNVKLKIKKN